MKRLLGLALLGILVVGGFNPARAQLFKLSGNDKKSDPGSRDNPLAVGPWYAYWPLESHFQVPGVPHYPNYSAPMTLPVTPPSPYALGGHGSPGFPSPYQGNPGGQMPYATAMSPMGGNFPGTPYGNAMPQATSMPFGGMPYPAMGYPGMSPYAGYPGAGMQQQTAPTGYPGMSNAPGVPTGYPGMPYPGMMQYPTAAPYNPYGAANWPQR